MENKRTRAPKGEGGDLREELLQAAETIVQESGSAAAVTVRTVAERVGVSQGALYLHFRSRDELVYELAFYAFLKHSARLDDELKSIPSPLDRITRRGESYIEFALENPALFHPLLMGTGKENTPDRFDGYEIMNKSNLGDLLNDVRNAMDQGLIDAGTPELTAALLWMSVHGAAALLISIPDFPWPPRDYLVSQMLALTRKGMGGEPRTQPAS